MNLQAAIIAAAPAGFTRAVFASSDSFDLELLVRPDTDFDDRFTAWDIDAEELLAVNGWLFEIEEA